MCPSEEPGANDDATTKAASAAGYQNSNSRPTPRGIDPKDDAAHDGTNDTSRPRVVGAMGNVCFNTPPLDSAARDDAT